MPYELRLSVNGKVDGKEITMAKFDIYEAVTDRIIEQLEQGIIPWHKPWVTASVRNTNGNYRNLAVSHTDGRIYSALNQMLLMEAGEYATFDQIRKEGGHVRKGQHGKMIVFWKMLPIKETDKDGNEVRKIVPMLKYYTVFNILTQCEGIAPKFWKEEEEETEKPKGFVHDPHEEAEKILHGYWEREEIAVRNVAGDRAFYSPSTDSITLPEMSQFREIEEYYSTAFHESAHSTGNSKRLDRFTGKERFGNEEYSKEELVAEISAAMLVYMTGLETEKSFRNSAAYVQSWLQALKNDKRMIVSAAGRAEKAVAMIIGTSAEEKVA